MKKKKEELKEEVIEEKKKTKKEVIEKNETTKKKVKEKEENSKKEKIEDNEKAKKEIKEGIKRHKKEKQEEKVEVEEDNTASENIKQEKVSKILKKAKENGKITYGELATELDDVNPEQIDEVFDEFEKLGVDLLKEECLSSEKYNKIVKVLEIKEKMLDGLYDKSDKMALYVDKLRKAQIVVNNTLYEGVTCELNNLKMETSLVKNVTVKMVANRIAVYENEIS